MDSKIINTLRCSAYLYHFLYSTYSEVGVMSKGFQGGWQNKKLVTEQLQARGLRPSVSESHFSCILEKWIVTDYVEGWAVINSPRAQFSNMLHIR